MWCERKFSQVSGLGSNQSSQQSFTDNQNQSLWLPSRALQKYYRKAESTFFYGLLGCWKKAAAALSTVKHLSPKNLLSEVQNVGNDMGYSSAQGQTLFQEVQENSASPAQEETQKDLMEEEESSNRQILEKQSLAQ